MSTQIDLLTALKLLEATATEEVKPILKAAIEEIKYLRQEAKPDWPGGKGASRSAPTRVTANTIDAFSEPPSTERITANDENLPPRRSN